MMNEHGSGGKPPFPGMKEHGPGGKPPFLGMKPLREIEGKPLGEGLYAFTAPPMRVHQYLVLGSEKALLIDTGFGIYSLKDKVSEITSLPVIVLNTHAHPDHCGGNAEFDAPLLHPDDFEAYAANTTYRARYEEISHIPESADYLASLQPDPPAPVAIREGEVIDLGGRQLEVHLLKGHTRGSIALFDRQTGSLFAGDNIQQMTNLTEKWASSVEEFLLALQALRALPITKIYSGHNPMCMGPEWLESKIRLCERLLGGEQGVERRGRGGMLLAVSEELTVDGRAEESVLAYDPNRIRG